MVNSNISHKFTIKIYKEGSVSDGVCITTNNAIYQSNVDG